MVLIMTFIMTLVADISTKAAVLPEKAGKGIEQVCPNKKEYIQPEKSEPIQRKQLQGRKKNTDPAQKTSKAKKAYKKFLQKKKYNGKEKYYYAVVNLEVNGEPTLLLTSQPLKNTGEKRIVTNTAEIYQYQKKKVKKVAEVSYTSTSEHLTLRKGYLTYGNHRSKFLVKVQDGKLCGRYYLEKYNRKTEENEYYRYQIRDGKYGRPETISEKTGVSYIYSDKGEQTVYFAKNGKKNREKSF